MCSTFSFPSLKLPTLRWEIYPYPQRPTTKEAPGVNEEQSGHTKRVCGVQQSEHYLGSANIPLQDLWRIRGYPNGVLALAQLKRRAFVSSHQNSPYHVQCH